MANRIVSVHAVIYGIGIYAIMLPSRGFSVAHYEMHLYHHLKANSMMNSSSKYSIDHILET